MYVPSGVGGAGQAQRILTWVNREGREEPVKAPVRGYAYLRLSPEGTRVALDIRDQMQDIWVWDLRRETLTRLTFDPGQDSYPVWTPHGRRLLFSSPLGGQRNVVWQAADGTGPAERLTESSNVQFPYAVSPDGTRAVIHDRAATYDLLLLLLGRERRTEAFGVGAIGDGRTYDVSPDGRRFLMIKQVSDAGQTTAPPNLVVVQNWSEELKRLVPAN